uniref:Uncharacterized protein n=1 Tax=Molossus molossus TaxID=27622 RepID=A0A7J8EEF2_MOLMO|nr:hypothetical protein HJG59_008837 [Molossus molossus]
MHPCADLNQDGRALLALPIRICSWYFDFPGKNTQLHLDGGRQGSEGSVNHQCVRVFHFYLVNLHLNMLLGSCRWYCCRVATWHVLLLRSYMRANSRSLRPPQVTGCVSGQVAHKAGLEFTPRLRQDMLPSASVFLYGKGKVGLD